MKRCEDGMRIHVPAGLSRLHFVATSHNGRRANLPKDQNSKDVRRNLLDSMQHEFYYHQ